MEPVPLHPNVRKLWQTTAWIITVPPALLVGVGGALLHISILLWGSVVLIVLMPALFAPRLAYRRWRYAMREKDLYTSKGALWHVETLVPFDRIQFVESRQGPLDRRFKLTQVIVYTAAGKAARIPGLDRTTAESIREDLSQVAGTASV